MKWIGWLLAIALAVNGSRLGQESQAQQVPSPRPQTAEQKRTDKIRADVTRRGVGEKSRVRVRLRDKKELKGHITRIDADSFEVMTDPEPPDALPAKDRLVTVRYVDVAKIKGPQPRILRIGTDVGLTIAVIAVLAGLGLLALWEYDRKHGY